MTEEVELLDPPAVQQVRARDGADRAGQIRQQLTDRHSTPNRGTSERSASLPAPGVGCGCLPISRVAVRALLVHYYYYYLLDLLLADQGRTRTPGTSWLSVPDQG